LVSTVSGGSAGWYLRRSASAGEIDVVAVNDIGRIEIMAHLLKYDSRNAPGG
jgi:glyceraldehyde-3-phosphate dehydrogenase/erythrose-4-phosphate dehydrogenase